MGLLFGKPPNQQKRMWGINSASDLIPPRVPIMGGNPAPIVTNESAMRHSAVWACLRLRADAISTLPFDVYRNVTIGTDKVRLEVNKPPVLVNPGGERVGILEWLYSSQVELDRSGNSIGLITARDRANLPARIDLKQTSQCQVLMKGDELTGYRINGVEYVPEDVWHEKQFTLSGLHVGLSPVAYAAWTLGEYQSIQQFVTAWYAGSAVPRARMRNTERKISPKEAVTVKEAWRASQALGEPFVHGSDWEYDFIQAGEASKDWLEGKKASVVDVSRFFGCPPEMIAAAASGESIRYANITQRNLEFLILHLGPSIIRREDALSRLLTRPRFAKFNTNAFLRMDPATRVAVIATQIDSRTLCPTEARALDDREPFTEEQMAEFDRFWPPGTSKGGALNPAEQIMPQGTKPNM